MIKYIILLMIYVTSVNLYSAPKIKIISGESHNWGEVSPTDSPLKQRISFTNVGDQPLRVYEVKPSCGCTTAPLDKDVIMPGDTANIDINLDLKDMRGNIEKSVKIMTNDESNPNAKVKLFANVVVPITKLPSYLAFGLVEVGTTATGELELTNNTNEEVTIMRVIKTPKNLNVNVEKGMVLKPNEKYVFKAELNPQKAGKFNCAITLMTDNIDSPRISISGWGKAK